MLPPRLRCSSTDGSVEPSIYGGVVTMPTIRRIRLEVCNNEFRFSQISGVLDH